SRSALPISLTSFLGREREAERLKELLATRRLVTLTGPPGTGKTRLALEVAADLASQFADGVVFVPLAPIRDPDLDFPTIAQRLGVPLLADRSPVERLIDALAGRRLLLVLDN